MCLIYVNLQDRARLVMNYTEPSPSLNYPRLMNSSAWLCRPKRPSAKYTTAQRCATRNMANISIDGTALESCRRAGGGPRHRLVPSPPRAPPTRPAHCSVFTSPHGLACDFALPPKPPPRRPSSTSSTRRLPSAFRRLPAPLLPRQPAPPLMVSAFSSRPTPTKFLTLVRRRPRIFSRPFMRPGCPARCRTSPNIPAPPTTRWPLFTSSRRYPLHPPWG